MTEGPGHEPAAALDPARVRFVLVEPQTAGNIGAAARALKNLGFSRWTLVAPQCDPASSDARRMAVDARDLLDAVAVHERLDDALDGAVTVVGSTRRTGKQRRPHWRLDAFAPRLVALAARGELAVVFGREDRGLTDEELDRCTHLVHLPTSESYPSLNLAQSVLLVAWELRRAALAPPVDDAEPLATHASREALYRHLEQALRAIEFVSDESCESILRKMRRLYGRATLSEDEARMLRGLARQILWAAGQAGLALPPDANRPDVSDLLCEDESS